MHYDPSIPVFIYDADAKPVARLVMEQQREVWPPGVNGWTDCLDCTVAPYKDRPLRENLLLAARVNKAFVVMAENDGG